MIETLIIAGLAAALVGLASYTFQLRANLGKDAGEARQLQTELKAYEARLTELQRTLDAKDAALRASGEAAEAAQRQLTEQERDAVYKRALTLTLANAAIDGLIVVDRESRIIAINNSAENIFGADRPIGLPLVEVTKNTDLAMMVDNALANEEESFEEQLTIGDRNYRVHARVTRRDGYLFIGLALQDVTRLVRLNRARRDMVANISHELRHPIANIRLTIDSLFHEQDKPKRKDTISSLRTIARETDALMWLVQEMSDLAMIESGQAIVRMVEVALNELIDESLERLEEQIAQRSIKIVRDVPERLQVLCDRDLAHRVLINLVHNALKWSPRGETVTIQAVDAAEEVTISILDHGPGVPDDQLERIFERFYQVDASRSGAEGTGLGLAICRHIVEAHGGRIWAEGNSRNPGGRFRFTLLRVHEQSAEIEPSSPLENQN